MIHRLQATPTELNTTRRVGGVQGIRLVQGENLDTIQIITGGEG